MALPLLGVLTGAVKLLPILKRKGVQGGVAVAAAGLLGHAAEPLVTSQNLVQIIDALSNLLIAVGTMGAIWKGRKPRKRERKLAPLSDG